jgi:hypothetical protein
VAAKLVDKLNDVVENITAAASNAAQHVMESTAKKLEPNPEQVADTANEQSLHSGGNRCGSDANAADVNTESSGEKVRSEQVWPNHADLRHPVRDTPPPAPMKRPRKARRKQP